MLGSSPWLVLVALNMLSAGGLLRSLEQSPKGAKVVGEAAKLFESKLTGGSGVDVDDAMWRLGEEVLEAAGKTQLGIFFAASLATGCAAAAGLVTKALFLGMGQLSATETSRLTERLREFVMLKVVFWAVCSSSAQADMWRWLAWTLVMGQAFLFTKLCSLRGDALLSSPSATLGQHLRILLLLGGILAQDLSWIAGYLSTGMGLSAGMGSGSLSRAALWLFDAVFVAVDASFSLAKYAVHAWDHWQAAKAEARGEERAPWEGRSALIYWLELCSDLALLSLVLAHYLHLMWLHGFQASLVDGLLLLDVRFTLALLSRRLRRHCAYARLSRRMGTAFPDAEPAVLEAAGPCCICLDSMKTGKQLPCSHAMHASCLCAWLQQSGPAGFACPLCRASLDIDPPASRAQHAQHAQPAPQPALQYGGARRRGGRLASRGTEEPPAGLAAHGAGYAPPARPFTRLQARRLAAEAAAGGAASDQLAGLKARPPRRIDQFLD